MTSSRPLGSGLTSVQATRRQLLGFGAAGLGLAALGLAGCTPQGSATASKTFTFTFWGTGAEKTAVSQVVNGFAKTNGLTGKPESIPQNYETKLNTLIAANNAPDSGYLTEGMAMRLGTQGKVVNGLEMKGSSDLLPSVVHYYNSDSAATGPALEAQALWYDGKAFKDAGVTAPFTAKTAWTWDDYIKAADALTVDTNGKHPSESGFNPASIVRYGTTAPSGVITLVALLKSNGIDLFDDKGTKTNIDSPEAIEVLQNIADLIFEHRVAPTTAQSTALGGTAAQLMGSGKVAMVADGQWALIDLAASKVDYQVAVLPKFKEYYTCANSSAVGVFTSSKLRDEGLQFAADLTDPAKNPLFANGLWMPVTKKYYTDEAAIKSWIDNKVHPKDYRTAVLEPTLNNSVSWPAYKYKNFSAISGAFFGTLPAFFVQKTDIKAKAKQLAAQVNPLMQGAYPDTKH